MPEVAPAERAERRWKPEEREMGGSEKDEVLSWTSSSGTGCRRASVSSCFDEGRLEGGPTYSSVDRILELAVSIGPCRLGENDCEPPLEGQLSLRGGGTKGERRETGTYGSCRTRPNATPETDPQSPGSPDGGRLCPP